MILTGIAAHTVHRSHPQPSLLVAEQSLHIIVRQTQGIVSTEILDIGMSIVAVQAPECGNPDLSCGILLDGLYATVRQFICHYESVLLVLVVLLAGLCLMAGRQETKQH